MSAGAGFFLARRGGPVGRQAAVALDLVGTTGPRQMLRRRRQQRRLDDQYPSMAVNRAIWDEAAAELGAEVKQLEGVEIEIGADGRWVPIHLHVTPIDGEAALARALEKSGAHRALRAAGVALPEQVGFSLGDLGPALRAMEAGGSWVVKPDGGSSGKGTTTGVRDEDDLRRAAVRAGRGGPRLLLERQVEGDEYRLLLLDGEPIGLVRRHPPAVIGDGTSSIGELVLDANDARLDAEGRLGLGILTIDLDADLALRHAGLAPSSVPAAGERVAVKGSRSQAGAGDTETVPLAELSPAIAAEGARAAAAVGLRLAGIDFATPDLGRGLDEAGGAVIEINGTPGLHYHYLVRDPERAERVAVPILRTLLSDG